MSTVGRIRQRRWGTIAIALSAALLLSSCAASTPVPTIYDLAGTWQHQSRTNPSTLILRKDGTLAIANVPEGLLSQQLTQNGHLAAPFVTVSGTWTIGSDGTTRTKDGTPYLDLPDSERLVCHSVLSLLCRLRKIAHAFAAIRRSRPLQQLQLRALTLSAWPEGGSPCERVVLCRR
jgi:hypothetical protein